MSTARTSGMQSNVAALLSYVVIIAIVFLIVEPFKNDKFVRFHAFQSIFYWIAVIVIFMLIGMVFPLSIWLAGLLAFAIAQFHSHGFPDVQGLQQ